MRIAIYGAGSLGTILGAFLTKGGMDVDLITRNREHVDGLNRDGARITGTVNMKVPVKALVPEQMKDPYDMIFLMTKQTDNPAVVKKLSGFLKDSGIICTFQNGLPEYSVAEVIGGERTFGCTVAWGATLIGNGVCELTSDPDTLTFSLGSLDGTGSEVLQEIKEILELMGPVHVEKNFMGARWAKLIVNSSFSGMSAVTGFTFGETARNRISRLCVQKIIKETIDTAEAAGITVEPIQGKDIVKLFNYNNIIKKKISGMLIPAAMRKHKNLKASMLQDLEKGKKTEIDSINGVVCSYGRKHGVPTPVNDLAVKIVHGIENGEYVPSSDNLKLFRPLL